MTYTEHRALDRAFKIFDCIDIEAQVGDYIAEPGFPALKVIERIDLGDCIRLKAQPGNEKPWIYDLPKPETKLREQERNQIEANEVEMGEIIHLTATEKFEVYLAMQLDWMENDNWLTEPLRSNPSCVEGLTGEQEAELLPPVASAYHDTDWTDEGCEF